MTLEELDFFRVTVNVQNITKAAEKLYITQPALSRIISRLEAEVGAPLFDRVGKNMIINENGRILYEFATQQHYAYTDLLNELSDVNEGISGSLNLAIHGMEYSIISREVLNIIREYPNIKIRYSSVSASDLASGLLDTTFDVGITTKPIQNNAIHWHEVTKDCYGILMSPEHPLCRKKILQPEDIENEKFILIDAGSGGAERVSELGEKLGFQAHVHYQIDDVMLARDLIASKYGIALETYRQYMISQDMQPDEKPLSPLEFRLLDPKVSEFTYSIGILKDRRLQRPARLLYERVCSTDGIKILQDYLLQEK